MKKNYYVTMLLTVLMFVSSLDTNSQTLYDSNNQKVRGTPMVLAKHLYESNAYAANINNWYNLKNNGFNTVRLCWVGPYYRDEGFDHWSAAEVVPLIEQCVANANATGMNIIINYHNVNEQKYNGPWTNNFSKVSEFWGEIAWRYKDNPLVMYEIVNEPTFEGPQYLDGSFKSGLLNLYNQVRNAAPNSQILMFSFNSLTYNLLDIVNNYAGSIDWTKTSVAFHSYNSTSSANVQSVMNNNYRVICTEWNYPGSFAYVLPVDGYDLNGETWERKGVSQIDWRDWEDNSFQKLFGQQVYDAKKKGYWWAPDAGRYKLYCKWGDLPLSGDYASWSTVKVGESLQEWELEYVFGNVYRLRNVSTGLYLNGGETPWTDVRSGPLDTNFSSQLWAIEDANNANYRLRCLWGNNYLNGFNYEGSTTKVGPLNPSYTSMEWYLERIYNRDGFAEDKAIKDAAELNLKMFPNPSSNGRFTLFIDQIDDSEKNIKIYNLQGREVFRQALKNNENIIHTNLTSGIYIATITTNGNQFKQKIIIE